MSRFCFTDRTVGDHGLGTHVEHDPAAWSASSSPEKAAAGTSLFFIAKIDGPALETLAELLESGKVKPAIERTYPLDQLPDALRYVGAGHAHGKVVVTL
jgi:NADPH:quinone reductase-like Zn-dependent oxidoreductase